MFLVNSICLDPALVSIALIQETLKENVDSNAMLTVDWTKHDLTTQNVMERYLPLVQFAHRLGYRVEVKIPLRLMSQFSYSNEPIVFCGHTMNPFAFDQVDVILE